MAPGRAGAPMRPAEEVDVLDERGARVGTVSREEAHARDLLHRCVHVLVFTPDGRLWLQKRALDRSLWPGLWTSSVSGHVDAGEDERAAAVREAVEEIGLALTPKRVGEFRYRDARENELAGLWEATTSELPKPGAEVLAVIALGKEELAELHARLPERFTPSFAAALRAYGWEK
jgi:16S rRNA (adenine1518-N6/adenine1519-N6)-dimethyltransferase